jgi:triosephosphate isomerase
VRPPESNSISALGDVFEFSDEQNVMRPLIAGHWKMHGTSPQLAEIEAIATAVHAMPPAADILVCPPLTLVARAALVAAGRIAIGGQNCSSAISGACTGDVSAQMLKDAGASWVIVGHSERRQHHGETDALVAAKAKAAWLGGLLTIICIGETDAERRAGQALSVCAKQLAASVPDGMITACNAIGYEPLWAIGTGHTPGVAQVAEVHAHIRQSLVARFGAAGSEVRILYGGSVNPENAHEFLSVPEVGGALIGGASLKAQDFNAIIRALPVTAPRIEHSVAT